MSVVASGAGVCVCVCVWRARARGAGGRGGGAGSIGGNEEVSRSDIRTRKESRCSIADGALYSTVA